MFTSRSITILLMAMACATTSVLAKPSYAPPNVIVDLPELGEAQADALSGGAGAAAAASRLNQVDYSKLLAYGLEIGNPLLVKPYPPITNLYAASLPPRTLVGRIEPVIRKDGYGKLIFNGESTIAVVAV